MRRLKPEYMRRLQRDGGASANRWLKATAWELGRQEGWQHEESWAGRSPCVIDVVYRSLGRLSGEAMVQIS